MGAEIGTGTEKEMNLPLELDLVFGYMSTLSVSAKQIVCRKKGGVQNGGYHTFYCPGG